ncbi:MAG: tetratricopeptide repeat protein [Candidatus Electrothrix sp. YB6]
MSFFKLNLFKIAGKFRKIFYARQPEQNRAAPAAADGMSKKIKKNRTSLQIEAGFLCADTAEKGPKLDAVEKENSADPAGTAVFLQKQGHEKNGQGQQLHNNKEPIAGGVYALKEQKEALYQLVKVMYVDEQDEQVVHVIRYAARLEQLSSDIADMPKEALSVAVNAEDGAFGTEHLPIPRACFVAHSVLLRQEPLSEADIRGYQLYVDSIFDCLDEYAPEWLKRAGHYAAWRNDHHAMAALADRYLVGVDLPRDSRKSLYWLNRLVEAGRNSVHSGESVREEQQIFTGGIYVWPTETGQWGVSKVVLKDRHGVQQLIFPAALVRRPTELNPVRLIEQASAGQQPVALSHVSGDTDAFLAQDAVFAGVLPVTADELHCYRAALQKMFAGAEFRPSAWKNLLQRGAAGDLRAQTEIACTYRTGDPLWEVKQNLPEAVHRLTEAANAGHGPAAYHLAELYQQGEKGIPSDQKLAFEWLAYAAQLNWGPAQLQTADCCRQGKGCRPDPALAHAWYSVAAAADNDLSEQEKHKAETGRKAVEQNLSAGQLARAQEYFRSVQEHLAQPSTAAG